MMLGESADGLLTITTKDKALIFQLCQAAESRQAITLDGINGAGWLIIHYDTVTSGSASFEALGTFELRKMKDVPRFSPIGEIMKGDRQHVLFGIAQLVAFALAGCAIGFMLAELYIGFHGGGGVD